MSSSRNSFIKGQLEQKAPFKTRERAGPTNVMNLKARVSEKQKFLTKSNTVAFAD